MTDSLGAVVVGTAFGGRVHVPALRAAGFEVLALVGRDEQRTAARAAELGVAQGLTSLDEALALPGVDVVTVSTPPDAHVEPVLAAAANSPRAMAAAMPSASMALRQPSTCARHIASAASLSGNSPGRLCNTSLISRAVAARASAAPISSSRGSRSAWDSRLSVRPRQ